MSCHRTSTPARRRPELKTPTIRAPIIGPEDRAPTAEERDAADHHGGDGFDWPRRRTVGRDRADAADRGPGGQGADEAGDHVDRDQRPVGAEPDSSRRLLVVADGVDMPAPGGMVEDEPEHRRHHDHQDDAPGQDGAADAERSPKTSGSGALGIHVLAADRLVGGVNEVQGGKDVQVPSVAMKGGSLTLVTSVPLIQPQTPRRRTRDAAKRSASRRSWRHGPSPPRSAP